MNISPWNNLSIADRAAMMEVAVRNGITDLNEIRQKYNEFAKGGNLYPDGGYVRSTNDHPVAFDSEGNLVDQVTGETGTLRFPEILLTADPDDVARGRAQRWYKDFGIESNDATSFAEGRRQNSHLNERGAEGTAKAAGWAKDHPVLNTVGLGLGAAPFAVAAYPGAVVGGELLGTALANPYVDAALTSYFGAHGLQSLANGTADWTTALELTPLGRLARPLWNAGKEGLQYAAKAADNATRYMSPSYDLYRTIGETTPRTTPTYHGFRLNGEQIYTGSPLFEFGQTMGTSPEKAYFMRAPKDVDVLKLGNGKFRHEVVGNNVLPSGEVNGKFVSYGEPWQEFALGENSALYEFPVGPRRGPSLMATNWKGRPQKYSVDEVYDYMQQEEALRNELASIEETMGDDFLKQYSTIRRNLINEKYPALKEHIDTSIYGANQTVIPNERWSFDKFLKTPFWKYSENPTSGQVQKELMMRWPEAKPFEGTTAEWADAARTPQITADNAAKNSSIMADANDFSYKGLTSDMSDFFEKMTYSNKIHGKPMVPSDEGVGGFSKSVQVGIPKTEYDELLHDVVGRNIREFKQAGLSDAQVSNYINNAKDAMDNVHIGMYSDSDYIKGGWEGFGGFYDSEGNFISVNTGSPLPKTKVVKHEGRHLLDHKVDDEILMPASENFGKDFDSDIALSTMQKVKQNQNMTLYDAYDNDFMTLPSKEGFNEGLEGYSNMDREAITTNLDSRNELLGSKADWDLDITDKIIDKMPDTAIFDAVEKANGYGRRYIKFLRDNNKLTPQKAQQFREAMKHVGAVAVPVGLSYMSSGNENAYGGNLYPYGGTKKQVFLTSLDQSLKEDNRFDNAQWRQFFTDLANMESGYSPNITNSIGAKGYFQLMPFNRTKAWKNPTQQFHEMYKLTGNNLNYLNKNLTKEDWKRADALGIDMYGMLAGAHLGGAGNVLKALRGKGNAKDMNGSSVMKYMTKFSQKGAVPTLATPTYYEDAPIVLFAPSNPEVFFGGYKAPEIEAPLPSVELEEPPQYSEEEIARQERRERLNNLSMLMSLTSPQGSNNSMLDAIGLLMR